jgi:hypothetical protein
MKLRIGFVSNSSSTSYICDICGETYTGYDSGLEDGEMFMCTNGHTLCDEHAIEELFCDPIEGEEDEFNVNEVSPKCCPICQYQEISHYDARRFLLKEYKITEKEVFDEIKKINKRRKKLHDEEYVEYVFKEKQLTSETFIEMIKKRFPIYEDYLHYAVYGK